MTPVRIVTDSTTRFTSPNFLHRHSITLAPIKVRCGAVTIQDDPETDLVRMQSISKRCQTFLATEVPSQQEIAALYASLQSGADQILSIHTSSGLSEIVTNAKAASQHFLGRVDIQVIDSQSASIGLGWLVQAAAEAAARGESLETLVRIVRGLIPRLYMVFFLDDLTYLEQNGLISRSQAILGNMLGIIPFLTMEEGRMIPMEKVRSRPRAVEKLIEFVCEFSDVEQLAILQGSKRPTQESISIMDRLRGYHPKAQINTVCYGPSLSTFIGFNSLGVAVLEAEESTL
jgi:DegV family protein with EDD domain